MTGNHHQIDDFKKNRAIKYDTKSKIILVLFIILVSLLIISFEQLLFLYGLIIYLVIIWKTSMKSLFLKVLVPLPLIISLSALSFISELGDNSLYFTNYGVIYSDLEFTIFLFLRSMAIVFISIALVDSEESFFEIIYALDELGLPDLIISILLLMYRSTIDIGVEAKRMLDVRYSRSTYQRWGTNLYSYRIIGYMLGGILVRSFQKKNKRNEMLYSRKFSGKLFHKPKPFKFNGILSLWMGIIILLIILLSTNYYIFDIGYKIQR